MGMHRYAQQLVRYLLWLEYDSHPLQGFGDAWVDCPAEITWKTTFWMMAAGGIDRAESTGIMGREDERLRYQKPTMLKFSERIVFIKIC